LLLLICGWFAWCGLGWFWGARDLVLGFRCCLVLSCVVGVSFWVFVISWCGEGGLCWGVL